MEAVSMQRKPLFFSILLSVLIPWASLFPVVCFGDDRVAPITKNGKKWRIAYYESGPYKDYVDSMHAVIKGLMELGWIDNTALPRLQGDVAKPYWEWLVKESKSRFLEFRKEDAYSVEWLDEKRAAIRDSAIQKLKTGKIDLIIAMGTWSGQDLANTQHSVPTTVLSTSNPIQAKIIKSAEDSGLDHVTARVDPDRYLRQVRMFHRLTAFQRIGVAYGDTPEGRIYSALPDLERAAAERGFKVVSCRFADIRKDREAAGRDCMDCFQKLTRSADAVYITALLAVDEKIEQLVDLLKNERIPSFSMTGSEYVKRGILMSISTDEGHEAQGRYDAKKIAQILNGAKPRDLEQVFGDPLDIAINMETAGAIGFEVPGSILRIANEIYGENAK
jgi:ABC-type uncharacterized transport system substrate-binding protein